MWRTNSTLIISVTLFTVVMSSFTVKNISNLKNTKIFYRLFYYISEKNHNLVSEYYNHFVSTR